MTGKYYNLDTAADILNISSEAVRKRLERGSLEGNKVSGKWQVFLPDNVQDNTGRCPDTSDLIEQLRQENHFLKEQIDRKDNHISQQNAIIYNLGESVKQLEAPRKPGLIERIFKKK